MKIQIPNGRIFDLDDLVAWDTDPFRYVLSNGLDVEIMPKASHMDGIYDVVQKLEKHAPDRYGISEQKCYYCGEEYLEGQQKFKEIIERGIPRKMCEECVSFLEKEVNDE